VVYSKRLNKLFAIDAFSYTVVVFCLYFLLKVGLYYVDESYPLAHWATYFVIKFYFFSALTQTKYRAASRH
jgi:hypothetical protein